MLNWIKFNSLIINSIEMKKFFPLEVLLELEIQFAAPFLNSLQKILLNLNSALNLF